MTKCFPESTRTILLVSTLITGLAASAVASDGVVEINQARALTGGVTTGDTPGFPVTLSESGSYRLTGNLDLSAVASSQNVTAILVAVDDVSIDLAGFSIRGSTTCTGSPPGADLVCTPIGTGDGINASGKNRVGITNGSIRGVGDNGVFCGRSCNITGLRISSCGSNGILAADGSIVRDNTVERNRSNGIAPTNTGGLILHGNTATENGNSGIWSGIGDIIEGNSSQRNRNKGFFVNGSSVLRGNTAFNNGSDGIWASTAALVVNNVSNNNLGFGLAFYNSTTPYEGNVVRLNTAGTVSGGTPMGLNFCNSSTTCP